jgi:2-oxo-3-hexenedioate decarboxylase/2-keto-4-pentenoate hydratase
MDLETTSAAARYLGTARLDRVHLDNLGPEIAPADELAAYTVQDALHEQLTEAGMGTVSGHKIGCTTPIMQRYLNIDSPCAGGVFDQTAHHRSGTFEFDKLLHPGVECELAVRLRADLVPGDTPYDAVSVADVVETVTPAIEIVDDRWIDYKAVETPSLIADDFFGTGCVLGDDPSNWRNLDLRDVTGTMTINGENVGSGSGAAILDHPLSALAWLANLMGQRGKALRAGEFVLLGSLVETKWVERGDVVEIDLGSLGGATARFV